MRKRLKFEHESNMFGHSYFYQHDQTRVQVLTNCEQAWHVNHKRVSKQFFWFRAPKLTQAQLEVTMRDLGDLASHYELKVWLSDKGLDASLKLTDDMDAAQWAWSHTEMWAKWDDQQELDLAASQKPTKIKVDKHGNVKVKVTMSEISDL